MAKNIKQADGVVSRCSSRVAKSGSYAHGFFIGKQSYSIFTPEELSPVMDGDRVRFEYEVRRLRSGSRSQYCAVIPESLHIDAPYQIESVVRGQVYVLSNSSMRGLLKIGYTTRNVTERVAELSGQTNMPTPFKIEWVLAVMGDPMAVEQRTHIHLAKKREGREFFRVSLEEAKEACLRSFAETHPEQAEKMSEAHSDRAKAALQRRDELAQIKTQREEEKRKLEERTAFWASRDGKWISEGRCLILLHDFDYLPNRISPSIIRKLFGEKFEDYLEADIFASERSGLIEWLVRIHGRIKEKSVWRGEEFQSMDEGLAYAALNVEELGVSNRKLSITIPVCLIENPPPAPSSFFDPLLIPSAEELIIRPDPHRDERKAISTGSRVSVPWSRRS
jgi:hypothetical protein